MPLPKQATSRQYSFSHAPDAFAYLASMGVGLIKTDGNSTTTKFVDEDSNYRQYFEI